MRVFNHERVYSFAIFMLWILKPKHMMMMMMLILHKINSIRIAWKSKLIDRSIDTTVNYCK